MRSRKLTNIVLRHFTSEDLDSDSLKAALLTLGSAQSKARHLISNLPHFLESLDQAFEQNEKFLEASSQALAASNKDLQEHVNKHQLFHQTTQAMINSLEEGFIVFDKSGIASDVFSAKAEEYLGESPAQKNIVDLFNVPQREREGFLEWFEFMFSPGIEFQNISSLGPTLFEHPSKFISIRYKPIIRDQKVQAIIVILTDQTSERTAHQEIEKLRAYSEMLTRFFANRDAFMRVLDLINIQLRELEIWNAKSAHDHEDVMRIVHNIKGCAGSISAISVQRSAHEAEAALILEWSRSANSRDFEPMVHTAAQIIRNSYNDFLKEHHSVFGFYRTSTQNSSIVSFQVLAQFFKKLNGTSYEELKEDFIQNILLVPVSEMFVDLRNHAQGIARSVNKEVLINLVCPEDDKIYPLPYRRLCDTLFHLVNNCLDHGIELPEERIKNHKPAAGVLNIHARIEGVTAKQLHITIADDGRGISPEAIRQKLYAMGIDSSKETDAQVIYHIFDPGFSTRSIVSELSGRGLGMDSVHHEVKLLGGRIEVSAREGEGTRFEIFLPYLSPTSEILKLVG